MSKEITIRKKIYLGALLHDIGKFYQRADTKFSDKENELSEYSKKMAEDICPINDNGRFGYQHVIWTNEFFEKFREKIEQIPGLKQNLYSESTTNNIVNFACNHHKPQTKEQAFVTLGDWWSAGIDRNNANTLEKESIENEAFIKWGRERYKTIPLYSVFNQVNEGNYNNAFKLETLSIDKKGNVFPANIKEKEDGVSELEYKELWNDFVGEFDKLPTDDIDAFTESLLFLLKKYTWSIPSNTMDMANVSLFEHLKTTAAFADSIYMYEQENPTHFTFDKEYNSLKLNDDVYPVLLVGGDISGIQKFIYNIASSKAAVSLKGRSFYLQLLIDSIIQKIIMHDDIQATIGHVVYSSGGKFYMILPNTDKVKSALINIKKEIENELWEEHKGKLSVNITSVGFALVKPIDEEQKDKLSIEEIETNTDIGQLWRTLAEKINIQKNQKFNYLIKDKFNEFFDENSENLKTGGDTVVCTVTGEELNENNREKLKGTDDYVSSSVSQQTNLGIALKDADYLITYRSPIDKNSYLSNRSKAHMKVVGIDNYMFDQEELTKDDADFRRITSADVSRIMLFNNTEPLLGKLKGNAVSYGFQFYGGNKQAEHNGIDKTFEELAKNNNCNQTYLGILRIDVDNLGNIFINGLPDKGKSFAAYATMSFQLDLFFSGYLNTIRNSDDYKDWVNILYSGGDDVFAVGRWDKLIMFAEKIRKEFAEFIGRNDISISAGVSVVRNKYPIAKAAELAGDAEEMSKKFNKEEKNAITFLGECISWNNEFNEVKDLKNEFIRLIENGMSKSILHKLMEFSSIKKANDKYKEDKQENKVDLSYKWNTAYYLKRFSDRNKKNNEVKYFVESLQTKLFINNRSYDLVALSARWAELELKEIIN